jgi:hypothetical protein
VVPLKKERRKKEPVLRKELKEEEEIKNDWKGKETGEPTALHEGFLKDLRLTMYLTDQLLIDHSMINETND